MQIVKYFLDSKTSQKVKFVYPKNKDTVELMKSYFDVENLPTELGGKSKLEYNHEEFSKLMAEDDLNSVAFWGSDDKLSSYVGNGHSGAEVAPDPVCHETSATWGMSPPHVSLVKVWILIILSASSPVELTLILC